jgi:4-amino-4-deoxy-L-arabinose transferase-like glycosyltransferase
MRQVRRRTAILVGILALALAARVLFSGFAVGFDRPPVGDAADYHRQAENLAAGRGLINLSGEPTCYRPPGYPLFLAPFYAVLGARVEVAVGLQIVLGLLVVLCCYLLARRFFSESLALVAAAIAAVNPLLIFASAYALTENLYTVLLLVCLISISPFAWDSLPSDRRFLIGGVLLGAAALVRPNGLPLALFACPAIAVLDRRRGSGRLRRAILFALGLVLVITPWTLRNRAVKGEWVMISTNGGTTFYLTNNHLVCTEPRFQGNLAPGPRLPHWEDLKNMNELERDREAWRLGMQFLKDNPDCIPGLIGNKLARFWRLRSGTGTGVIGGGWWWNKNSVVGGLASRIDVGVIYSALAMPLFVLGLAVTAGRYRELIFLYGVVIVHTLTALVFFGSLRARIPVEPVMAVFASAGLAWLALRVRARLL